MDGQQFRQWQALLEMRTGVCVSAERQIYLQTSLGARMRVLGISDYQTYYEHVTDGVSGAVEWSALVACRAVRETSFMRHRPSFECAAGLLRERLQQPQQRPLRL